MVKTGLKRRDFWVQNLRVDGIAEGIGVPLTNGNQWFVDGDRSTSGNGSSWDEGFATIQEAVTAASAGDVIFIVGKTMSAGATDPSSYEENIVIPAATSSLALIGVSRGRAQGGLPQLKDGATTTQHILVIRAPGCLVANLGFNGTGNTGGGILLDDDGSTKTAFGTTIANCHFKNCKGTTATNAATGGAINWPAAGNAWQVLITGCKFYKNVGDIVVMGTSGSRPQDVVIEDCIFSGPAASVDCNIYTGGSGVDGIYINNCVFPCKPAIGSGTNAVATVLTGSVGILSNCFFGFPTQGAGIKTLGASGDGAVVPTTVLLAGNYGEADTEGDTGYAFRT